MASILDRILNGIGFTSEEADDEPREVREPRENRDAPSYNDPPTPAVQRRTYTSPSAYDDEYSSHGERASSSGKIINYPSGSSSGYSSAYGSSTAYSGTSSQVRGRTAVASNRQDIVVVESFEQVNAVIDNLLDGVTTNVNIEKLNAVDARRVLDVLGGAAYALQATHRCCGPNVYLLAPYGVEVDGEYEEEAPRTAAGGAASVQSRYYK